MPQVQGDSIEDDLKTISDARSALLDLPTELMEDSLMPRIRPLDVIHLSMACRALRRALGPHVLRRCRCVLPFTDDADPDDDLLSEVLRDMLSDFLQNFACFPSPSAAAQVRSFAIRARVLDCDPGKDEVQERRDNQPQARDTQVLTDDVDADLAEEGSDTWSSDEDPGEYWQNLTRARISRKRSWNALALRHVMSLLTVFCNLRGLYLSCVHCSEDDTQAILSLAQLQSLSMYGCTVWSSDTRRTHSVCRPTYLSLHYFGYTAHIEPFLEAVVSPRLQRLSIGMVDIRILDALNRLGPIDALTTLWIEQCMLLDAASSFQVMYPNLADLRLLDWDGRFRPFSFTPLPLRPDAYSSLQRLHVSNPESLQSIWGVHELETIRLTLGEGGRALHVQDLLQCHVARLSALRELFLEVKDDEEEAMTGLIGLVASSCINLENLTLALYAFELRTTIAMLRLPSKIRSLYIPVDTRNYSNEELSSLCVSALEKLSIYDHLEDIGIGIAGLYQPLHRFRYNRADFGPLSLKDCHKQFACSWT